MEQEEFQKCSSSGGGGNKLPRKVKQKKIPQRGLGVAQLEKIRLDEQLKKEGLSTGFSSLPLASFLPLPTNYHQSSVSTPFPVSSPSRPILNLDLYGMAPPLSTIYGHNASKSQGEASFTMTTSTGHGHSNFPTMWNPLYDMNTDREGLKFDPGFAFRPHLQTEVNPIWPTIQRRQPQQQHCSKVNVCSSTSSSSGLNLQMEPPSNQSFYSNFTSPLWPDEEKMVGVKRLWPFSTDNPPGSPFHSKFPTFLSPNYRFEESSSCSGMFNFEQGNTIFREGVPVSTALQVDWRKGLSELNSKKGRKEFGVMDTLLTLGPGVTSSKAKGTLEIPPPNYEELSQFNLLPYQDYNEDPYFRPGGSAQLQPFYNFFPPNGQQNGFLPITTNIQGSGRSEISGLDLDLKL